MAEPLFAQLASQRPVLTITQLTQQIKGLLEGQFRDVWVRGEISNFKPHTSGHWYFTLKDAAAQLRSASFRLQNRFIKFKPENGLEVFARGRLSVYEPRGDYQLIVEDMEPVGVGSLQLAFEQLKTKLAAEGLFDLERKRPLPLLPHKVGVVTSPTGAVIRDILRVLRRRNNGVSVLLYPVAVQGEGAAQQIAKAIGILNQRDDIDVLIVGRGGGSMEDLWPFNEEIVARAIFASRIPVVSAVGHETDVTIADFVADVRAPTPSAAAEQVAARRDDLVETLEAWQLRLNKAMHLIVATLRHRISEIQARRGFGQATGVLQQYIQRIDDLDHRLQTHTSQRLQSRRDQFQRASRRMAGLRLRERVAQQRGGVDLQEQKLIHLLRRQLEWGRRQFQVVAGKLNALSPLAVLERGYAVVRGPRGDILRRAADVTMGEQLLITLAHGQLTCVVAEVNDVNETS